MAEAYVRARAGAINAAHSPLSIFLFTKLLVSLPRLIKADSDLIGMSGQDPAVDSWLTAAETARATTLARLRDLGQIASGTALGDVGDLFERMMTSDDPEHCTEMRRRAAHDRQAFLVQGTDRMSRITNQMIHRALDQLEAYCALEDDVGAGEAVARGAPQASSRPTESLAPAA